jgi:hypothetical protein
MLKNKTVLRSVVVAAALVAASLGAIAQIVEPPRPTHPATRAALATTTVTPKAAVASALVKDVDQPARAPFQATVTLDFNNFVYTPIPIPSGQRLVVEYVSITGAAQSNSGPLQPIVLLSSSVAGNPGATFYFGPTPVAALPTQFYHGQTTAIYADSLQIGPGYAGYTPAYMIMNVVVSGHLVAVP